jgi:hypothetical protein
MQGIVAVIGGSTDSGWATTTSDKDYFLVVEDEMQLDSALKMIGSADIEWKSQDWVYGICKKLDNFSSNATVEIPSISYLDLRFLARILLGSLVFGDTELLLPLKKRMGKVTDALSQLNGTIYFNIFQDIIGFLEVERYSEATLISGDLAQRATTQAILYGGLAEPSPKWGLHQCLEHESTLVRENARAIESLFSFPQHSSHREWLINLISTCNGIIAAAVLHSRNMRELPLINQETDPEIWKQCIPGIRPYTTILDPHSKIAQACNLSYLVAAANSFTKRIEKAS